MSTIYDCLCPSSPDGNHRWDNAKEPRRCRRCGHREGVDPKPNLREACHCDEADLGAAGTRRRSCPVHGVPITDPDHRNDRYDPPTQPPPKGGV